MTEGRERIGLHFIEPPKSCHIDQHQGTSENRAVAHDQGKDAWQKINFLLINAKPGGLIKIVYSISGAGYRPLLNVSSECSWKFAADLKMNHQFLRRRVHSGD